jgi:hypothetical protein
MNCPSPLRYFLSSKNLHSDEKSKLAQHAGQCQNCIGLQRDAKKLAKLLHKDHQPVLSRCEDAMTLARYLQGRLDNDDRTTFTIHLASCDACLGELSFALRQYPKGHPSPTLQNKIVALFKKRKNREDALGRSEDVYGEASTSGDQPGLLQIQNNLLPTVIPNSDKPRRRSSDAASDEETPGFDTAALPNPPFPHAPQSPESSSPTKPGKISLRRSLLFAFIGAGLVVVLAVIPLFKISKDLFRRARKSEIRISKAIKDHEKMTKQYAQATSRIKSLESQLKKRPTMEMVNRYKNTARIWKTQFKRSQEAAKRQEKNDDNKRSALKLKYDKTLNILTSQLEKEQTEKFPHRFFQVIAGRGYPKVPGNEKLIELVKTSNDKVGVAAFFTLEQRGLGTLAVALANKRSKLSLLNFLARPYLASLSSELKHWDLLSALLHKDIAVQTEAQQLLRGMKLETHGYKLELVGKDLNDVVATMAADWNRRYNKSKGPYELPYREEN